jgi:hypothetical protein
MIISVKPKHVLYLLHYHFIHYKPHVGSKPVLRGEKSVTNHLNFDTTIQHVTLDTINHAGKVGAKEMYILLRS